MYSFCFLAIFTGLFAYCIFIGSVTISFRSAFTIAVLSYSLGKCCKTVYFDTLFSRAFTLLDIIRKMIILNFSKDTIGNEMYNGSKTIDLCCLDSFEKRCLNTIHVFDVSNTLLT
ncbi:hypothetical protein SLW70_16115 [Flavobacterium sp. NG2]|uniref:hypothetical protein n=1 Tax=Flavobacterium sp. NG2 TaxID=3097547 RepID=UPI002A822AD0|nr:hypothetical protein [Flavobacterium sp. NG2]WPR71440.1 hypothetical protein SLW70_16115 [Flavobacterium sp. NG2]